MKILHTSDWHLGQYFMGKSRQREHQLFLDWLISQTVEQEVDALIVAGDIFDTGAPPSYARELYHKFVIDFCKATANSVPLILLAGNHDSVAMLQETSDLLTHFNTFVTTTANETTYDDQIIEIKGEGNSIKGIVCAVPFLRIRDLITSTSGSTGKEKQRDMQSAIEQHYRALYEKAKTLQAGLGNYVPIVMTGHLTVVGASTSESVRDIYIGSLDAFSASAFPPADYIALGHIHKKQKIKCDNAVYYSGSPIPLSFDELKQEKSIQYVSATEAGVNVREIAVPRYQAMFKVTGNLEEIASAIESLKTQYSEPDSNEESVWLEVEVSEQDYLDDLQKRIEALVEDSCIEVLCLKRSRNRRNLSLSEQSAERLQELSPAQVFDKRLALESEAVDDSLKQRLSLRFKEVLDAVSSGNSE